MKRNRIIIPVLLFLLSFGIYLKTLCPTVTGGDSGELIANAYTLGITHPTGHPLYCLLGRLFTFLPFGSIAYRVNLMSAFFASLTVVLVYLVVLKIQVNGPTGQRANGPTGRQADRQTGRLLIKHIPPIVASLTFAFSKSFWQYAGRSEIYTLKAFFLALLIFILLKWKEALLTPSPRSARFLRNTELPAEGEVSPLLACGEVSPLRGGWGGRPATGDWRLATCNRYLYLFALIYGLSFSNHITMVLFFPAFLYLLVITDWRSVFNPKNVILVILLFLLGLSCYLYLPFRSLHNPPLDWGDPETLRAFIHHVSGGQYHYRLFDLPFSKIPVQIKRYGLIIFKEFTWLPLALGIFGFFSLVRRKRFLIFTGLLFLIEVAFNLANFELELPPHLYLSSFLIFSLWIGYGIRKTINYFNSWSRIKEKTSRLLTCLLLLLPLVPAVANYQEADQSQDYEAYDVGKNVLDSLEENAILIGGDSFTYWYLQYAENQRPDVITICRGHTPHLYPWYLRQLRERYPDLILVPEEGEVLTGKCIKDREFVYPISEAMLEKNKARAQEEGIDEALLLRDTTLAAIMKFFIERNLDRRPIYLGFMEDVDLILPEGCHPISNGLFFRVKRGRPRIVVRDPRITHKIEANFANGLLFLGYDIDREVIAQGDLFSITYYWKILKEIERPPNIILLFTDREGYFDVEDGAPKFYQAHFLGYGLSYPKGAVIKEKYLGLVPSDISPGRYYLTLAIMEEDKVWTTPTSLSGSEPFLSLGEIEVLPRERKR